MQTCSLLRYSLIAGLCLQEPDQGCGRAVPARRGKVEQNAAIWPY